MQNAKDSFYIALRNRLSAVSPTRVVTLRGVVRPGILVEEAESPTPEILSDVFVLRWLGANYDAQLPLTLVNLTCELVYATSGSVDNAGLDRGRAMAAMDAELIQISQPESTPKYDYTQTPPLQRETAVSWSGPVFKSLTIVRDRLVRSAAFSLYSFEEGGEL